ncbi:ATP-binding protein [Nonomuraea sp. NPDC004186]
MLVTRRPLTGRSAELDHLVRLLDKPHGTTFVLMTGDPGIGKSRLLTAVAELARERGLPAMAGRATEFERSAPFGILFDALADGDRHLQLAADLEQIRALLSAEAGADAGGVARGLAALNRHRLFRASHRLVERISERDGLVVLLDDVQWADDASIEALDYFIRHPPDRRVIVLLAARTGGLPAGLTRSLAAASVVALPLGPLSAGDADALLGEEMSAPRRRRLYERSGGNPLFLEILAALPDGDDPAEAASPVAANALDRLIAAELSGLDQVQGLVARAAAVVGDELDATLVAAVSELDLATVVPALDDLVHRNVLSSGPRTLGFRHPLVRAAAYRMAGPAWRMAAHRRAAEYLRAHGAPAVRCAVHMEHAIVIGDAVGAALLAEGADAVAATAPATAARWFRAALRALPDDAPGGRRAGLLLSLAAALGVSGQLAESRTLLREVMQAGGDHRDQAVELMSMMERSLGRFEEARAILTAELGHLDQAPGGDSGGRCALLVELAANDLLDGRWDEGRGNASLALGLAGPRTRRGLPATAVTLLAVAALYRCDFGAAYRYLDRADVLVNGLTDRELCDDLGLVAALAWGEFLADRNADALRHLARGLRVARDHGRSHVVPLLYAARATVHARLGDVDRALGDAEEAEEIARHLGSAEMLAFVHVTKSRPLLWLNGPDAAMPLIEPARRGQVLRSAWWRTISDQAVSEVLFSVGETEACGRLLASRVPADPAGLGPGVVGSYALRSEVEVTRGDLTAGREWYERAARVVELGAPPVQAGFLARARAVLALAQGRQDEAEEAAREAVDRFAAAGLPIGEALGRMLLAGVLRRDDDSRAAKQQLGQAKELFLSCGAPWLAAQVGVEQRRMAAGLAHRPGAGSSLSEREREIAELVAYGMTNREIGERLFLSPRTVETHLASVFRKLGVKTRAALAHRLAE